MYDVTVIGAGPAGATLARLLGGRYKVLLLEGRSPRTPSQRHKPCGGLLAPDAQRMLAHLGLALPQQVLQGPQVFAVQVVDFDSRQVRHYQRHYLNVDRAGFDRWLLSLVPPSVDVREGARFVSRREGAGCVEVRYLPDGRSPGAAGAADLRAVRTRVLVDAGGAAAPLRRFAAPPPTRYVTIQDCYEASAAMPYFCAVFDRRVTDFYSWVIPKGDTVLVGSALPTRAGAVARFELLLSTLRGLGLRTGHRLHRQAWPLVRPASRDVLLSRGACAWVGEAAGFVSPSSGEGISFALASAEALASALAEGLDDFGPRYHRTTRSLRMSIRLKNFKCPLIFAPALRRSVLWLGINSIPMGGGPADRPAGAPAPPVTQQ